MFELKHKANKEIEKECLWYHERKPSKNAVGLDQGEGPIKMGWLRVQHPANIRQGGQEDTRQIKYLKEPRIVRAKEEAGRGGSCISPAKDQIGEIGEAIGRPRMMHKGEEPRDQPN